MTYVVYQIQNYKWFIMEDPNPDDFKSCNYAMFFDNYLNALNHFLEKIKEE